jgi:hypothetical protein
VKRWKTGKTTKNRFGLNANVQGEKNCTFRLTIKATAVSKVIQIKFGSSICVFDVM